MGSENMQVDSEPLLIHSRWMSKWEAMRPFLVILSESPHALRYVSLVVRGVESQE